MPNRQTEYMTTDLHISECRAEDREPVRQLILEGLAERWGGEVDESLNPDLGDLASAYAGGRIVVGRVGDRVVATGMLKPVGPGVVEIVRMSVASDQRRNHHGTHVLQSLLQVARQMGANRVVLETCDSWKEAIRFYLSFGFTITHYRDSPWCREVVFAFDLTASVPSGP